MAKGKRVQLEERDGILGKECTKCGEWKELERDFSKDRKGTGGKHPWCNSCKRKRSAIWREKNSEKKKVSDASWYRKNADRKKISVAKRRALERSLPTTYVDYSINYCRISNDISIHWDHVIPLATGHGGTVYGNMIPLRSDLNESKTDSNIFEWFASVRQRFELSQERFDKLIDYLASANALMVEEYRDFVYWCHDNPRNIDEIKRDQRHSIEIWREAVGKQFPLPSYAMSYENNIESEAV